MNSDNIVMWVTRLALSTGSIHSKTQTLLATLRTRNQPREESCVSSEDEHLSPPFGCARNKRQYPTVLQSLALDLGDMVIEVLRSTNNTARPGRLAQGDSCGTFQQ